MSYTPTSWQSGDVITAEKLNKMEQGIAGGSNDVFTFIAEYANSNYTFDHTLDEIANAVINGKTIVCVIKWGMHIGYSFVEAYTDGDYAAISVTPVIEDITNDGYSVPQSFSIVHNGEGEYVCVIASSRQHYIVPLMDSGASGYSVPMLSVDNRLTFRPINIIFFFDDTIEQLVLASMQMSDVAAVFSDGDTVANSSQVVSSAIENFGFGRGVIAAHSFNNSLTNCGMLMTGFTEVKDNDNNVIEQTVYSHIDVVSTTTEAGVYSAITTGHGTLTLTVNYEDGEPLSAMAAIHMDVHTPTVL